MSLSDLEAKLLEAAEACRPETAPPVDVHAVARQLGLEIRVEIDPRLPAGGSLQKSEERYEIVLRQKAAAEGLTTRDRFTIAHELGHYFLDVRWGYRPSSKKEYWDLEDVCNTFARRLLVSPENVRKILTPVPRDSRQILGAVHRIVSEHRVSHEVAARCLVEWIPNAILFEIGPSRTRNSSALGTLLGTADPSNWLGSQRGKQILKDHKLAGIIQDHATTTSGEVKMSSIGGLRVASKRLGKFIHAAAILE